MSRPGEAQLNARRRGTLLRALYLVVRVLAVLACLEISGSLALAAEIGAMPDAASDDCCSDCPLEKDGKECPPMCPACHCTHAVLAVPAALTSTLLTLPAPASALRWLNQPSALPPSAPVGSLYRPPRSTSVLI
jgi:hypothetical protein